MGGEQKITGVLLLGGDQLAEEAGTALWSMLLEVGQLYQAAGQQLAIEGKFVARHVPERLQARLDCDDCVQVGPGDVEELMKRSEGPLSGTFEHRQLAEAVRDLLRIPPDRTALVLTDLELSPPEGARYRLWESSPAGWVGSVAPMDPTYWGSQDAQRVVAVKRRARAAVGAMVGAILGFERCDNHQCFLFRRVDSVLRLDHMRVLGGEHDQVQRDEAVGYRDATTDPEEVLEVLTASDLTKDGWVAP
jgi:hypothetical protein